MALRLAGDKRAAAVLAASALGALAQMQAPTFSPGWEIPVTLRAPPAGRPGCAACASCPAGTPS
jgi:hypothetical protein